MLVNDIKLKQNESHLYLKVLCIVEDGMDFCEWRSMLPEIRENITNVLVMGLKDVRTALMKSQSDKYNQFEHLGQSCCNKSYGW